MVEGRSPNLDNKGISIGQGSHLQEQIKDEFIIKNIVQEHNITYSYGCWVYTNLRMIRECIERGSGGGMGVVGADAARVRGTWAVYMRRMRVRVVW